MRSVTVVHVDKVLNRINMTREEYNQLVISVVELITANNAGGVARALKNAGYNSTDYISEPDLKVALLQLHATNPEKFYEVLQQVQWNFGKNNWTNDPQYRDPIVNSILREAPVDTSMEKGAFWGTILGILGTVLLPSTNPTPAPVSEQKTPWALYILVPLMIGAVILILVFGLKALTPSPSK